MPSLATTVKGQGVGSAYKELIHLLTEYGKDEIEVRRRAESGIFHFHTLDPFSLLCMKLTRKPTIASVHFVPETMEGCLRLPKPIQRLFDAYMLSFYRSADYLHTESWTLLFSSFWKCFRPIGDNIPVPVNDNSVLVELNEKSSTKP